MTMTDQEHEILARVSSDDVAGTAPGYSVEFGRSRRGLLLIASRRSHGAPSHRGAFTRAIEAPTASELEFEFERLCFELSDGSVGGFEAADVLSRLFTRAMCDVSERVRIANQSAKAADDALVFDVGAFRWGPRDHEFACRLVDSRTNHERSLEPFDRVFRGATLGEAFEALRQHWRLLGLAAREDAAQRALLEAFWHACERAMVEARQRLAGGSPDRVSA